MTKEQLLETPVKYLTAGQIDEARQIIRAGLNGGWRLSEDGRKRITSRDRELSREEQSRRGR